MKLFNTYLPLRPFLILLTFMEACQHQRVLHSNAPTIPSEAGLCFNSGYDCGVSGQHHACSDCHDTSHGVVECKSSILQDTSGNVGFQDGIVHNFDGREFQYGIKSPFSFDSPPLHSAQAAIKREHRRRREFTARAINLDRCEWESKRYENYRNKQATNARKGGTNVWTHKVEEAFQNGQPL